MTCAVLPPETSASPTPSACSKTSAIVFSAISFKSFTERFPRTRILITELEFPLKRMIEGELALSGKPRETRSNFSRISETTTSKSVPYSNSKETVELPSDD